MQPLVIRDAQMDTLEDALVRRQYEDLVLKHVRNDPELVGDRDEEALRALARDGMRRAKQLGAAHPSSYAQFVLLMLYLGDDFMDDPANGWARDIAVRRFATATTASMRWSTPGSSAARHAAGPPVPPPRATPARSA